jgi:predicted transcriptional regulator
MKKEIQFDRFEIFFQEQHHINMNYLESKLGVSRGTFSKVYKKQRNLSLTNQLKLIDYFDDNFTIFEQAVYPHNNRHQSIKLRRQLKLNV